MSDEKNDIVSAVLQKASSLLGDRFVGVLGSLKRHSINILSYTLFALLITLFFANLIYVSINIWKEHILPKFTYSNDLARIQKDVIYIKDGLDVLSNSSDGRSLVLDLFKHNYGSTSCPALLSQLLKVSAATTEIDIEKKLATGIWVDRDGNTNGFTVRCEDQSFSIALTGRKVDYLDAMLPKLKAAMLSYQP